MKVLLFYNGKKIYIYFEQKASPGLGGLYQLQMWRRRSVNAGMTIHFELENILTFGIKHLKSDYMFGLFFCLFVTPVVPAQSPHDVAARITQETRMHDSSPEGLSGENICAGKEPAHLCFSLASGYLHTQEGENCLFFFPPDSFFGSRLRNGSSVPAGRAGAPDCHRVEAFMAPRTFRGEIANGATRRARARLLFVPWPLTAVCFP